MFKVIFLSVRFVFDAKITSEKSIATSINCLRQKRLKSDSKVIPFYLYPCRGSEKVKKKHRFRDAKSASKVNAFAWL